MVLAAAIMEAAVADPSQLSDWAGHTVAEGLKGMRAVNRQMEGSAVTRRCSCWDVMTETAGGCHY